MSRLEQWTGIILAAALATFTTGCHSAMSSPSPPQTATPADGEYNNTVADWPLRFRAHNFGASCFSTYGCKVIYDNFSFREDPDNELKISSAALGAKYPKNLSAGYGPVHNFPAPAKVAWRSKDGMSHEADIDIGDIFKDRLIRHNVAQEDIPETASIALPDIILEVNDRTINVYMRAFISLKKPRFPDRPHSDYQDELIKVYTRTY